MEEEEEEEADFAWTANASEAQRKHFGMMKEIGLKRTYISRAILANTSSREAGDSDDP